MRRTASRRCLAAALAAAVVSLGGPSSALASHQPTATKAVRYLGYLVSVPRSWPVYDLRRQPTVCVRFDRHALYLGAPSAEQRCPAHAVGRTESILLEPLRFGQRLLGRAVAQPARELALARGDVLVTATWASDPALVERALGVRSLAASRPAARIRRRGAFATTAQAPTARPAQVGGVFTGLGFDACSAPSSSAMSAWSSSPYRAVGVYIGGQNMACSQPNLTASWVSAETAAGWQLIPTYVGLQAPANTCGCAAITPSQAHAQGANAASDAVAQAQAVGIGRGNPIYDDMEYYPRGGTSTPAALAFLSSWTATLHADGYLSGVYGNGDSVISDLVAQIGTSYEEPDDIWIANWNGQPTTSDPSVPSGDWAAHQRLHQYRGGHNETYGGVTINVDNDYLDGSTVGAGTPATPVTNTSPTAISGTARVGETLSASPGAWSGTPPISYRYQWQLCSARCTNIARAKRRTYRPVVADIAARVRVIVTASNGAGSAQATAAEVGPITPAGYWLFTSFGNVYPSSGTGWYGSAPARGVRLPSIVGMATTPDGGGYWLAGASGRVSAFGDAARLGWVRRAQPVAGIVADPAGGYWLFTSYGDVYPSSGAGRFGSPAARGARVRSIVGMAATPDGGGYWLVDASGRVWAFGDAARLGWRHRARPVAGIVADPAGGYWLFTSYGNVYSSPRAGQFGSPSAQGARLPSIVGMATTPDGGGYWLVGASGRVWAFGDAARLSRLRRTHPIAGIVDG
jgi:hypothetical protein